MRLWTLHPMYLDRQGLLALWREGLLGQKVLAGKTKGYQHHPQLIRFRQTNHPLTTLGCYLWHITLEAEKRGYHFDTQRILLPTQQHPPLTATQGQIDFEWQHLQNKLTQRSPLWLSQPFMTPPPLPHPLFHLLPGPREDWEKAP